MLGALAFATAVTAEAREEVETNRPPTVAATASAKTQPAKKAKTRATPNATRATSPPPNTSMPAIAGSRPVATGAGSGYGVAPTSAPTTSNAAAVRSPAADMQVGEQATLPDSSADNDATPATRPNPNRYRMRLRLDDGRYRGFHQNNPDELRSGDAVQAENDRIRAEHRARGRDLSP
jgi:hypothetical protein